MIRQSKLSFSRARVALRWLTVALFGAFLASCSKAPKDDAINGATLNKNKAAVPGTTNRAPALVHVAHSQFSTNVNEGRDPFFPDSTRRLPKVVRNVIAAQPVRPAAPPSDLLKLTGLWTSKNRSLALINKTPLGPGEAANITVTVLGGQSQPESHKLLVRCLEVRSNSVVISVEGEPGTKELVLQSRL